MCRALTVLLLPLCLVLAACGGGTSSAPRPKEPAPLTGAQANPRVLAATAALGRVPATPAASRRLAFVDLERAGTLDAALTRRVLGTSADGGTGVRVGDAVLTRAGAPAARSAIAGETAAVVQICLGDALAETILGPGTVGKTSAIGAAVRPASGGGLELAICAAPHLSPDLDRAMQRLRAGFPGARVSEDEILERDIGKLSIAADRVAPGRLRELVAGGPALQQVLADRN